MSSRNYDITLHNSLVMFHGTMILLLWGASGYANVKISTN